MGKCLSRCLIVIAFFIFVSGNAKGQSVSITSPVTGSNYNVGDIIPVTATATTTFLGSLDKVVFTLGSLTPQTDLTSPYTASFNTSTLAAGSYTLTVTNYYTPFLGSQTTISTTMTINIASSTPAVYSNYAFSKELILNSATLGITSNLTNFPALVYVQDNRLKIGGTCADKVQYPNGTNYDFAFVSPNSAGELNYQVEKYDPVAGSLLVWVKIPALSYATSTPIYFYWGSASPPVTHNTAFFQNTWNSDYLAVFHFNEAAYTGSVIDGTAGGHTGATSGMTSADLVTGKIGSAYSFDGSSKKITSNAVTATGTFTLSAWVNLSAIGLDQKVITNQAAGGGTTGGYKLGVYTTNIAESESGTAVNRASTPNPTAFATGAWHYIQSVFTGATLSTYIDGTQYKILTTSNNPTANTNMYIGVGEGGTTLYFNGLIDEPRVSNIAKTADWIKAEYGNQNSPVTFTTAGSTLISNTNAAAIPGVFTYTWTGATSTDPAIATNWTNTTTGVSNQLPAFNGSATLIIPAGLSNYPSLTADASIYGLTISSGATLNLNGHVLAVGCNIYNSSGGQILSNSNTASQITFNGSIAAQSYNGTNTANTAQLSNLAINNSVNGTVTISGGPVDIYSSLTLTKGNLIIGTSPAALTLKSTALSSARVGIIPVASSITGNVNVERYLTGGSLAYRGYRLLSSPVYAATISGNNVFSINYLKNSIYLTATSTSGGFDNTAAANPTLYLYRENLTPLYTTFLNSNYKGINNIISGPNYSMDDAANPTINIPAGNGYLCFFRGNRASATFAAETVPSYVPQITTLTATGTLNTGQVIVKNWFTPSSANLSFTSASPSSVKGYNLVGNPYASAIDWDTFQTTASATGIYGSGVGATVYILDPISHNYGAYLSGTGGIGTNNATNVIMSGQGFFVVTSNTSAQLIFNESAKTSTQATGNKLLMGTPVNYANKQYLRLQLAKDTVNTDDMLLRFNTSSSVNYDQATDAIYKQGLGSVSLASLSGDRFQLAIKTLPLPKQSETIKLTINTNADGIYSLNMKNIIGIPQLFDVWLVDSYKKDSLDMRHNSTYSFDVLKSDSSTFGAERFSLIIRQNPAYAYRLLGFTASKAATARPGVEVVWKTENEQNYTRFTVERSTDNGKTFEVLGGFSGDGQGTYGFTDQAPAAGVNEYRLKQQDWNGDISYSNIIPVMYSDAGNILINNNIQVYPNPAVSTIKVDIAREAENTTYRIMITGGNGYVLKTLTSSQRSAKQNVSNLLPGTYFIQVVNTKDGSLVGQSKFVKL